MSRGRQPRATAPFRPTRAASERLPGPDRAAPERRAEPARVESERLPRLSDTPAPPTPPAPSQVAATSHLIPCQPANDHPESQRQAVASRLEPRRRAIPPPAASTRSDKSGPAPPERLTGSTRASTHHARPIHPPIGDG